MVAATTDSDSTGTMYTFLLVLMTLLAIVLCVIILLQSGKGGGLASTFGGASSSTDSIMGGRQAATLLTKLTWAGGGLFLFLGLVLSVLSSGRTDASSGSILRGEFESGTRGSGAPTSVLESENTGGSGEGLLEENDAGGQTEDGSSGSEGDGSR